MSEEDATMFVLLLVTWLSAGHLHLPLRGYAIPYTFEKMSYKLSGLCYRVFSFLLAPAIKNTLTKTKHLFSLCFWVTAHHLGKSELDETEAEEEAAH